MPSAGVDSEYDSTLEMLAEVENDAKAYLRKQSEHFGCKVSLLPFNFFRLFFI